MAQTKRRSRMVRLGEYEYEVRQQSGRYQMRRMVRGAPLEPWPWPGFTRDEAPRLVAQIEKS